MNDRDPDLRAQLLELLMPDLRFWAADERPDPPPVTRLPPELATLLRDYPFGGVILFRENLVDSGQIVALTDDLAQAAPTGRLIAIDQEGGTVTRIAGGLEMPGNMALGACDDVAMTTACAGLLGAELRALGLNFVFAPVLDVNSNPSNPIVGVRSFGSDPALVARHGCAFVDGLDAQDLAACAKHFPGHGDTETDSHHATPVIRRDRAAFEAVDLLPFASAIAHGVDAIMTAHIVAPALDDATIWSDRAGKPVPVPATLSRPIMTGLLRETLGYDGVIASDALDMKGITDHFGAVQATLHCLRAGVDLLLMPIRLWSPARIDAFRAWFDEVSQACTDEPALRAHVTRACARLRALKARRGVTGRSATPLATRQAEAARLVMCAAHRQAQASMAAAAITLERNDAQVLPWRVRADDRVLVVSDHAILAAEAAATITGMAAGRVTTARPADALREPGLPVDKLLLLTCNLTAPDPRLDGLVARARACDVPLVMLSCHNPYDVLHVTGVATNVLVYGASGIDQTNYSERRFRLNLEQALHKVFTASSAAAFCGHVPVDLGMTRAPVGVE
ncbi:MAG: glycoside hydrolase family 3 protein [Burkholderiaceae bacterium]